MPFIRCGAFVIAELDPIISFVNNKVSKIVARLKKLVLIFPSESLFPFMRLSWSYSSLLTSCCILMLDELNDIFKPNLNQNLSDATWLSDRMVSSYVAMWGNANKNWQLIMKLVYDSIIIRF